jgi:hypothetical protein
MGWVGALEQCQGIPVCRSAALRPGRLYDCETDHLLTSGVYRPDFRKVSEECHFVMDQAPHCVLRDGL